MGEQQAFVRFQSGRSASLGWPYAMNELNPKLPARERDSFYNAGLLAQQQALVIASAIVDGGRAHHPDVPTPAGRTYCLAWGQHVAYGTAAGGPFFVPTRAIDQLVACEGSNTIDVTFVDGSVKPIVTLAVRGGRIVVEELAEILDAQLTWSETASG